MPAVSRDRLKKSGIWASSLAVHVLVLILMGLHAPTVRKMANESIPPPLDVEIYELPPPPPPKLRELKAVSPPETVPIPPQPRATPEKPEPQPAPIPKPEPAKEPVRETPPTPPAPPKPKKEEPREPAPAPSPVKPREVAKDAPPAPIAPLPMAPVAKPAAPAGPGAPGKSGGGSPMPDFGVKPGGDLRDALRRSSVGCANDEAVGLNRREREGCKDRLGTGAKDAEFIQPPMSRAKREAFDATAARKARDRAWKETPMPIGIDPKANAGGGQPSGLDKP
ncbi:hypothetical protein [Caulobacter mirabilis]|uniref:hypothetical protein n=1 Tax=Caulobacter mirabilis TaxID=69666 RepID=UPI0015583B8E|nr:hypothetical protein [Caulobacter mirabilis]